MIQLKYNSDDFWLNWPSNMCKEDYTKKDVLGAKGQQRSSWAKIKLNVGIFGQTFFPKQLYSVSEFDRTIDKDANNCNTKLVSRQLLNYSLLKVKRVKKKLKWTIIKNKVVGSNLVHARILFCNCLSVHTWKKQKKQITIF